MTRDYDETIEGANAKNLQVPTQKEFSDSKSILIRGTAGYSIQSQLGGGADQVVLLGAV
jgi:hypothetical protein